MDVKAAAAAIDYEWQANAGEQEAVCMNYRIQMGFIYVVCAFNLVKKKKRKLCVVPQWPFLYLEIHCLFSGTLCVGDIGTCSLSNAELLQH